MNSLLVCVSEHKGNTLEVARAIGQVLDAEIAHPEDLDIDSLSEFTLVGFGSGIYYASHHDDLLDFVEELPEMEGKNAFIFTTSGMRRIPIINDFESPLRDKLLKKGFQILGEFSCRGFSAHGPFKLIGGLAKGRPNREDLKEAKNFARDLKSRLEDHNNL